MYNFMRKFQGGLLLVPMLLSAIFYTFSPKLFRIGGMTQAMFTTDDLNYVIGLTCFLFWSRTECSSNWESIEKARGFTANKNYHLCHCKYCFYPVIWTSRYLGN